MTSHDFRPLTKPSRPRRQINLRTYFLSVVVVFALIATGLVLSQPRSESGRSPTSVVNTASEQLGKASALHLSLGYTGASGQMFGADLTVTADQQAAGTVTDPGGGKADLVATSDHTAVRGDPDFWARRAPEQVGKLVDQWVQPESASAFPIDVASALNPAAIAELVRSLSENATNETTDTINGRQVKVVESGSWTALFSADGSQDLVWMGGPVRDSSSLIQPASFDRMLPVRPSTRSALNRIQPAQTDDDVAMPPYVSIAPTPTGADDTRTAVAKVLPNASPQTLPPKQSSNALATAEFQGQINASECSTPTCSWTITVKNVGRGAGAATVHASVTPGMGMVSFDLGTIPAGGSANTPAMTFANPAPEPAPGQTTRVTMNYAAWISGTGEYAAQVANLGQDLQKRGINPQTSQLQVDPGWLPTVLGAAKLMTDHAPNDQSVGNDALKAVQNAKDEQLLPELKAIVDSGRLLNPEDLAKKLNQPTGTTPQGGTDNKIGYRREIEEAAAILRNDPTAKVKLDGDEAGYQADILDVTNKRAYQVKSISSRKFLLNLDKAIKQLNGLGGNGRTGRPEQAPPGYQKIVLIYMEEPSLFHQDDKDEIFNKIRQIVKQSKLCDSSGAPTIDSLKVVTARGTFEWTSNLFGSFGAPCK